MSTSRRTFFQVAATVGVGGLIRWQLDPTTGLLFKASQAVASALTGQTPLPGSSVAQFVSPLPTFGRRRVSDTSIDVTMLEFQQKVLPDSVYTGLREPFNRGTFLWGYRVGDDDTRPSWPGRTVVARQGRPTTVRYENSLPLNPFLRKYLTIDQTVHWADPLNQHGSFDRYGGPIPTVVHLHGAEVLSASDGAPEAWFTSNGLHGKGYSTVSPTESNAAIYAYPNTQPATTLWFHDHSLGITRINILSGMAAFYLVRDAFDTGEADNPLRLPAEDHEIELMIQDRQFDTNGQLLFPDSTANPSLIDGPPGNPGVHPFWIPEFFGDTVAVNGRTWPVLNVEPRRYRFRFLNASNARFYRLGLADATTGAPGPSLWQIGTDGGLLDRPVQLQGLSEPPAQNDPSPSSRLFIAISERADVIIDFKAFAGKSLTLTNDAQVPFPSGALLDPADPTRNVMQFRVNLPLSSRDQTYDPASGAPLRGGPNQEPAIVRLANPTAGTLAAGVRPSTMRQLVLVEDEGPTGQPIVDLINNTKWRGIRDGTDTPIDGARPDQFGQGIWMTELPRVGSTEVWELLNLTVDAHPIHIHLIQFQLINRQAVALDANGNYTYRPVYDAEFPGGTFPGVTAQGTWGPIVYPAGTYIPGYGPPRDYTDQNKDHALGGNPAFSPFLQGPTIPPNPNEAGWKDTVKVFPGFVNRFVIRWAPTETAVNGVRPGQNLFQFDPTHGPGYGIHCHILDHEDNEMMRPYLPLP